MSDKAPLHPLRLDAVTLSLRTFRSAPGALPRSYLSVFEGTTATVFHLPRQGEVVIGRGREADLMIQDPKASRRHALLRCSAAGLSLEDQGSHNGTRVNGVTLSAPAALSPGDVITICEATLVLHQDAAWAPRRRLGDHHTLRQRLCEEVERALRYRCALSLLALDLSAAPPELGALDAALSAELRLLDHAAQSEGHLLLVLPELDEDEADALARRLLTRLRRGPALCRAGRASCPQDGGDADTLLAAALRAVQAAPPGEVQGNATLDTTQRFGEHTVIIADPVMVRLYALLGRLAHADLPVLIHGETGTGKEIAAAALHHGSPRRAQPLVALNCAALPESLIEGELFGYEKGAFSGAVAARAGLLERASGGTLFLDELGELSLSAQAKLLRALETRRVVRLGDVRERAVDLRIVAATNRQLEDEVKAGRFRQDLLYRLNTAVVTLPPLRDRPRELPLLARLFVADACARGGRSPMTVGASAMRVLLSHHWPGNLRELRNAMAYAVSISQEPVLEAWHLPERLCAPPGEGRESSESPKNLKSGSPASAGPAGADPASAGPAALPAPTPFRPIAEEIRELERSRMAAALQAAAGVKTAAAELIAMPLRTFSDKCKQYGLGERPTGRR